MRPLRFDSELLRAALLGYEIRRKEIDQKIAEIRKELIAAKGPAAVRKRQKSRPRRGVAEVSQKQWPAPVRRPKIAEPSAPAEAVLPGDDPTRPH